MSARDTGGPSVKRLRDLLDYDPATGVLSWRVDRRAGSRAGSVAGSLHARGYLGVSIDGCRLYCHRVAWAIVQGAWPTAHIDHINGDRRDNRMANLREATRSQNAQNRRRPVIGSKSGYLGVHWDTRYRCWKAQITVGNRNRHLGQFKTPEEASDAYLAAKKQFHPFQTIVGEAAV